MTAVGGDHRVLQEDLIDIFGGSQNIRLIQVQNK